LLEHHSLQEISPVAMNSRVPAGSQRSNPLLIELCGFGEGRDGDIGGRREVGGAG
jgi:hypothetical protein